MIHPSWDCSSVILSARLHQANQTISSSNNVPCTTARLPILQYWSFAFLINKDKNVCDSYYFYHSSYVIICFDQFYHTKLTRKIFFKNLLSTPAQWNRILHYYGLLSMHPLLLLYFEQSHPTPVFVRNVRKFQRQIFQSLKKTIMWCSEKH